MLSDESNGTSPTPGWPILSRRFAKGWNIAQSATALPAPKPKGPGLKGNRPGPKPFYKHPNEAEANALGKPKQL